MIKITLDVQRLPHGAGLPLPEPATELAAGVDLVAAIDDAITLAPGERQIIPTGLAIALPPGYEAQIRPRSGLAAKNGITLVNTPGTIDADYRGEIGAILINHGQVSFTVERGMRIAQMIFSPVLKANFQLTDSLNDTSRGHGGFGSTGFHDTVKRRDHGEPS